MLLNFKNQHIFFALESIWDRSNLYKFKAYVNGLIEANSVDDFVQEIEIPEEVLIDIFSTVTVLPEGMAASINKAMLEELIPQLESASNSATLKETETLNEAGRILVAIQNISDTNLRLKEGKIMNGKSKILR